MDTCDEWEIERSQSRHEEQDADVCFMSQITGYIVWPSDLLHQRLQGNDLKLHPQVQFFKLLQEGVYFGWKVIPIGITCEMNESHSITGFT